MTFIGTFQSVPSSFPSPGSSIFDNHPRNTHASWAWIEASPPASRSMHLFFPWAIVWNLASLCNLSWMNNSGLITFFFYFFFFSFAWVEVKINMNVGCWAQTQIQYFQSPNLPVSQCETRTDGFNLALYGLWASYRIRCWTWMASRFWVTHVNMLA